MRLLATALVLTAMATDVRASPQPGDRTAAPNSAGPQPEQFILVDQHAIAERVTWPTNKGVITEDGSRWLLLQYADGTPKGRLRAWTDALRCHGWHIASRGARGSESEVWLTHDNRPDAMILRARRAAVGVEVSVHRLKRLDPSDPWLPPSLAHPPLVPPLLEMQRLEVLETSHGRHVLQVAYPLTTSVHVIERAWSGMLAERGWAPSVNGGQRYFSHAEGTVVLVVWRGVGAIVVNLHRVVADDPTPSWWTDQNLPLLGVPKVASETSGTVRTELTPAEFVSIGRCAHAPVHRDTFIEVHAAHEKALNERGWRLASGRIIATEAEPSQVSRVFRKVDRELVVTVSKDDGFCLVTYQQLRPMLRGAALGPTWQGEDWAALAGKDGAIAAATQSSAETRGSLVIVYRTEVLGPGVGEEELCRRLQARWSKVLRARGWRSPEPPDGLAFVHNESTIEVEVDCDTPGENTVRLTQ
jgi:hypothetical protein